MPDTYKICPICEASNHRNTTVCVICGSTLTDIATTDDISPAHGTSLAYDYRYGETDLLEGDLRRTGQMFLTGVFTVLVVLLFTGLGLIIGPGLFSSGQTSSPSGVTPTQGHTPRPTLGLATVTPAPPTLTPSITAPPSPVPTQTPTREPCYQQVLPDDGLYAIVGRCGHRHADVMDLVAEINNLSDINSIREGDILEVPWPTDTPDPNASPVAPPEDQSSGETSSGISQRSAFDDDYDPLFVPTATLPPGIQFHVVQESEDIISIGFQHNASIEVLSQLNPEIDFTLCDLGATFGGARCTIILRPGQNIRVPAPTPTPTLPSTQTGSETPTPTATATFNAPLAQSPSNLMFFQRNEIITLRWVPSGTLGTEQTYRVRVEDTKMNRVYIGDTREVSFIIPEAWRGEDEPRHEYVWTVSVINNNAPDSPLFTTEPLTFTWEGRDTE